MIERTIGQPNDEQPSDKHKFKQPIIFTIFIHKLPMKWIKFSL